MTAPAALLTLDEAREELGTRAIALVEAVTCSRSRLSRLLHGTTTARGLPVDARQAARAYRAVLRQVLASDHGWILDEQIEGALSYAECLRGRPEAERLAA